MHNVLMIFTNCHTPLLIARKLGSAAAILGAGLPGLTEQVLQAGIRPHRPTLEKILAWAHTATAATDEALIHHRIMKELDDDRVAKLRSVTAVEGDWPTCWSKRRMCCSWGSPGSMWSRPPSSLVRWGRSSIYPKAPAITGRAGLFPSRYQSDEVDRADGPLVRCANRRLRKAIMLIADNLIECNDHFRVLAAKWRLEGKNAWRSGSGWRDGFAELPTIWWPDGWRSGIPALRVAATYFVN